MIYGFDDSKNKIPIANDEFKTIEHDLLVNTSEGGSEASGLITINNTLDYGISKNDYDIVSVIVQGKEVSPVSNRISIENVFWGATEEAELLQIGYTAKFIFSKDEVTFRITFKKKMG